MRFHVDGKAFGRQQQSNIQVDEDKLHELGFQNEDDVREAVNDARATWAPRDTGRNYPDHMLFALHVHAAWFGAGALAAFVTLAVPATAPFLEKFLPLYALVYAVFALRRVYGGSKGRAWKRAAIIFPMSTRTPRFCDHPSP